MLSRPKTREYLLLTFLVALALSARIVPGQRTIDDAYITFRYARNIMEGEGFAYNVGEPVLGTTTPLYTLLLASLAWMTGWRDFPALALTVNALIGAVSVTLLYLLARRVIEHRLPATAAALLWALAPYSVTFAVGGMETDLTIALLLGVSYAHLMGALVPFAILSALALLARPDTALLLLPLWLGMTLGRRRVPLREGGVTLGVLAPWLVYATLTFGSPLPASIAAKSEAYRLPPLSSLVRLIQHYSVPFLAHKLLGSTWQLAGFVVYLSLVSLGGMRVLQRFRRAWPLLAYPYLYLAAFAAANPLLFRWYLSPPLPFYVMFIVAGVWSLAGDIGGLMLISSDEVTDRNPIDLGGLEDRRAASPLIYRSTVLVLFTVFALASTVNAWELHPDHGPDRPAPEMAWFKLELLYERAAQIVLDQAQPGDTLSAGDIGALGYITRMPILDTVGLVTPASRAYYPADPDIYVINYAIPADLVLDLNPDFLVILEVYGRRVLLPDPVFQDRYQLLERFETGIYGSNDMLLFELH